MPLAICTLLFSTRKLSNRGTVKWTERQRDTHTHSIIKEIQKKICNKKIGECYEKLNNERARGWGDTHEQRKSCKNKREMEESNYELM